MEERINQLEFKTELLFSNTAVDRFVFESDITREEYRAIMDLMDLFRAKLDDGQNVSNCEFESAIYEIVPSKYGDYHFCEIIARLFAEEGRWEEVFPALYGHMPKYGGKID